MKFYQSNSAQPTTARSAVLDRAWELGGLPGMNGMTSAEWKRWAQSAAVRVVSTGLARPERAL